MERFDDVSVVASVDESPPPRQVSRRTRRAFTAVVATVVVSGALAGAAVGLADEKSEPSNTAPAAEGWMKSGKAGECRRGERSGQSSNLRY
jgi:hypothetical protein